MPTRDELLKDLETSRGRFAKALRAYEADGGRYVNRARIADLARPFDLGHTVGHFTRLFLAHGGGTDAGDADRTKASGRKVRADTG